MNAGREFLSDAVAEQPQWLAVWNSKGATIQLQSTVVAQSLVLDVVNSSSFGQNYS